MFLTSNENVKSEYLEKLKYVVNGAAPLGEQHEEQFINKAGSHVRIYQGKFSFNMYCVGMV